MKLLRRALLFVATLYSLTALAIFAYALLHPDTAPENAAKTDVIVVLGAGMDDDGTLHFSSRQRVEAAIAFFDAGTSSTVHFSGGPAIPQGPSAGAQMAAHAQALGVPKTATRFESRSQSTLQNAYFSIPQLTDAQSLRLVTEGFHLPRTWLSFRWAYWHLGLPQPQIELSHSQRLRTESRSAIFPQITMVLREAAAFWFNGFRLAAFELGDVMRIPLETREPWLD